MNFSVEKFCVEFSKNSCKEFVDYWKEKYRYGNETDYKCHIDKDLTKDYESLEKLFVWKNGHKKLSESQQKSIDEKKNWLKSERDKNCKKKQIIEKAEKEYLNRKEGGAIWNIFFLHCLNPKEWPIYDQHTYRAMMYMYIEKGKIPEDEKNNRKKYENYIDNYIPFFKRIVKECDKECEPREVDKALFAFGQFLKFLKTYKT